MTNAKSKTLMPPSEYTSKHGQICPQCRGTQFDCDSIDIDGKYATQDINCLNCGFSWRDIYVLCDYQILED